MNFEQVKKGLLAAADKLCESEEELCRLDSHVGDGDHGTTIRKAFEKLKADVETNKPADFSSLFMTSAMSMMDTAGGAIGPILSSMFMGFAQSTAGKSDLGVADLADMFETGMRSVQDMGGAKPGDRTLLDALYPAVEALKAADTQDCYEALTKAGEAAAQGAAATANMIATKGRAKNLGEKSLGYVDAGATSMSYFINAFAQGGKE